MKVQTTLHLLHVSWAFAQYAPLLTPAEAFKADGSSIGDGSINHICMAWSKIHNPLTDDCLAALAKMPRTPARRVFHAGEGGLPIRFANGKCEVNVFFKRPWPDEPEEASWLDITISATQLLAGCVKSSSSETRTRGEMRMNDDSKIYIEIRKPFKFGDGAPNNGSLEEVDAMAPNNTVRLATY